MSWSEEQKAKGRETRRINKEKREKEIKDLNTQISTLNMELIEREAQIEELREVVSHQGAPSGGTGSAAIEQDYSEENDLAERIVQGLWRRARDLFLEDKHSAVEAPDPDFGDSPTPPFSTTVTVIGGGLHQTDADEFTGMSVQKLNYVAAELGVAPSSQRDRLIEQIQEARQAK
jgi:hypothetical protein